MLQVDCIQVFFHIVYLTSLSVFLENYGRRYVKIDASEAVVVDVSVVVLVVSIDDGRCPLAGVEPTTSFFDVSGSFPIVLYFISYSRIFIVVCINNMFYYVY